MQFNEAQGQLNFRCKNLDLVKNYSLNNNTDDRLNIVMSVAISVAVF
jgi:hypothetical protein